MKIGSRSYPKLHGYWEIAMIDHRMAGIGLTMFDLVSNGFSMFQLNHSARALGLLMNSTTPPDKQN